MPGTSGFFGRIYYFDKTNADYLFKQFEPRSGPTWSGSKLFDTLKAISHPVSSIKGILSDGSYGDIR